MQELLILLVIVVVVAIVWYMRKESAGSGKQRKDVVDRTSRTTSTSTADSTGAAEPGLGQRGAGLFQDAADSAAGLRYERAADQLEEITADLARARQDAERAAEQLASRAGDALASIQAAAAAHGGAVPGDGTHNCPSRYPVKGNMASMLYHLAGQPSYNRTIPEVCFQSAEAAEAAGFTESGDEAGVGGGSVAAAEVAAREISGDQDRESVEEVVVEAPQIRDREGGVRVDVVAAAIDAADAGGVPPGAVRGDGSRDCPPTYPIKANRETMLYHEPSTSTYSPMIPEFCFTSPESAKTAGFAPAQQ